VVRTLVIALLALIPAASYAQPAGNGPRFDVASMKLVVEEQGRPSFRILPGRVDCHRISLPELIQKAYNIPYYQADARNALDTGHKFNLKAPLYDIQATMPLGTDTEQLQLMIRSLLLERLKLVVHWDKRDVPVYAVSVANGGLKMHASKDQEDSGVPHRSANMSDGEWMFQERMPLAKLFDFLRFELDRPIVDLTGLQGFYDIDLRWPHGPLSGSPGAVDMNALFSSMEKQLGLKVEAKKLSLNILVIDSFDRVPTAN
jgi:uncharacterized protein (TIGR03435 family)